MRQQFNYFRCQNPSGVSPASRKHGLHGLNGEKMVPDIDPLIIDSKSSENLAKPLGGLRQNRAIPRAKGELLGGQP